MSNKDLKNRTPVSNAVDTKLWDKFKQYSKDTKIPMSKLLDEAIDSFLKSTNK